MTVFDPPARVHIVGVGGAGMSGFARLLMEMGCVVSGSDAVASTTTDELRAVGVRVHVGHDASNAAGADVVIWSPAVDVSNVELEAARVADARLMSRAETLAELAHCQPVIGLTGTHGKTTATSMMVHVLAATTRDYSRLLGAEVRGVGPNGHWGPDGLVLEVDESYGSFARLSASALGLLNVEADHLDHYGTIEGLEDAFGALLERVSGPVVVWGDDPGATRVAGALSRSVVTVAATSTATYRVNRVALERHGASFHLEGPAGDLTFELAVTGAHNVANAAVVATLALELGVAAEIVRTGLAAFVGAPRRFEFRGTWAGADVYEDYAHLPGEIEATLEAATAVGYERITAVFQPHRVTRTTSLAESFAPAFDRAHAVVVTDIYRAGEANPLGVTGELVTRALEAHGRGATSWYARDFDEVLEVLETLRERGDVVIFMGAGDIGTLAARLIEAP